MTLRKHSIFFRALILGAQGVFYNLFCTSPCLPLRLSLTASLAVLTYMIMPAAAHRFVGYLEDVVSLEDDPLTATIKSILDFRIDGPGAAIIPQQRMAGMYGAPGESLQALPVVD